MLAVLTALSRASAFGNPVYQTDEPFYLYVGGAMLDGQLPYVDVWDRKPLGLFLIYAGIAALGGSGVEQYQLVSGIFAWLTALVIWQFGRRIASGIGGLAAAAAYLITLPVFDGSGGQSPVFYNLFMAIAALLAFDTTSNDASKSHSHYDYLAMLMAGIALTIKPSSVVEGSFLGLWLLQARRRDGSLAAGLAYAAKLILAALAPTALCFFTYALLGHASEYAFANFISIFLRDTIGPRWPYMRIKSLLIFLFPLLSALLAGIFLSPTKHVGLHAKLFVGLWFIAALIGSTIIPNFAAHYFLPLLVPLAMGSSIAMRSTPLAIVWLALISWFSWSNGNIRDLKTTQAKAQFAALTKAVTRELGPERTLFVFDGPTALYRATGTGPMSKVVLPDHFLSRREVRALGIDPEVELNRILARHPEVIVTQQDIRRDYNQTAIAHVNAALRRDYRLAARINLYSEREMRTDLVWARK